MTPVLKWSGREARALREARRMGVREFARHLGFSPSVVAHWEARGADVSLRQKTQQVLDTDLEWAPEEVRSRFELALRMASGEQGSDTLGANSAARTHNLLSQLQNRLDGNLSYRPPRGEIDRIRDFLRSSSRVYILSGPAGVGKTRLVYHLAAELGSTVDCQFHTVSSWEPTQFDLAAEILRYGSVWAESDTLLALEKESSRLEAPCLVVIDGISTQDQFERIGRQLDLILRQVHTGLLRFVLVVRTPPAVDTVIHPVLDAAVFDPPAAGERASIDRVGPWDLATARQIWNGARVGTSPAFEHLPPAVQRLVMLPLYMQLMLAAGEGTTATGTNAYRLIDHCARSILRAEGHDVETAIAQLADVAERQGAELVPASLTTSIFRTERSPAADEPDQLTSALLVQTPADRTEFAHDVLREYFLAARVAGRVRDCGRSVQTVSALNELALRAGQSASARSLFELVIQCLDDLDQDLLGVAALAPTIATGTTLPLMLAIAGDGAGFATRDVLRACALRCDQESALDLAQALLCTSNVFSALGSDCSSWLLGLLRRFGVTIWSAVRTFIELNFDVMAVQSLLRLADLGDGDEAIFFARYHFLFFGDDSSTTGALQHLLAHQNWRVRAALTEALRDEHCATTSARSIMDRLVADGDYKVRAAAAQSLHRVSAPGDRHYLATLLADENWHVRERVLLNLLTTHRPPQAVAKLAAAAAEIIPAEPSWSRCPAHVRPLLQQLHLTHGSPDTVDDSDATERALFTMLRETRTGWTQLAEPVLMTVVDRARRSSHWLVVREARALDEPEITDRMDRGLDDPCLHRESFRRRRGHRSLQVALDMHDLEDALVVARAAGEAGVDFVEVGDPLIKRVGLRAVEQVKRQVPGVLVVAEMMSADWGRDQVVLAAEAGADVVQLIGPATIASVTAATEAGRRLGIPIVLDAPTTLTAQPWVAAMERAGVDGFTVTTNIDVGIGSRHAFATAQAVRGWTQLPVAVSGGFSATDQLIIASNDWDILIVGRSVADAVDPAAATRRITESVRYHHEGRR